MLFDTDLADISTRAASIDDRMRQAAKAESSPVNDPQATSSLDQPGHAALQGWCDRVAVGDRLRFERRFRWDGLDPQATWRALVENQQHQEVERPPWTLFLQRAMAAGANFANASRWVEADDPVLDPADRIPFEEILLGFVSTARSDVRSRVSGEALSATAPSAHIDLERGLLRQLSRLAGRTFVAEFAAWRSGQWKDLAAAIAGAQSTSSWKTYLEHLSAKSSPWRAAYNHFAVWMLASGLKEVLTRFPVLARLLAIRTTFWIDATAELIERIRTDRFLLSATFSECAQDIGVLETIRPELSDSHHHGRTVSVLRFSSGLTVVYKPRDMRPEKEFFGVLEWLQRAGAHPALQQLRVLACDGYGWMEYVDHTPCADSVSIERYFSRAGALLCLAYVLGARDLHSSNVIARAEWPMIIDLEVIACAPVRSVTVASADEEHLSVTNIDNSVLGTGLLPRRLIRSGNQARLSGGFTAGDSARSARRQRWQHVNTDFMCLRDVRAAIPVGTNVPRLHTGEVHSAEDHLNAVIEGFRSMYRSIMQHRLQLIGASGPLGGFRQLPVRVVLRPTRVYAELLDRTLHPRYLVDGVRRSIELEILRRPFLYESNPPWQWPICQREQLQLERLDIPIFTTRADSHDLNGGDNEAPLTSVLPETGFDRLTRRVLGLSDKDCVSQSHYVRIALTRRETGYATGDPSALGSSTPSDPEVGASRPDDERRLSRTAALAEAHRLARFACRLAIPYEDGINWAGYIHSGKSGDGKSLQALGWNLYDGRIGVGLFLAAAARATGDAQVLRTGRLALAPLVQRMNGKCAEHLVRSIGIGGATGMGSIIYGLTRLHDLLDDPAFLTAALLAAQYIAPAHIIPDRKLDVMGGTAGLLLGLLVLYEFTADAGVRERAITCGRHLLAERTVDRGSGLRAWPDGSGRMHSGFAHGAAGIAHALLRLGHVTGDEAFVLAAAEAREFVERLYVPESGNWLPYATPAGGRPVPDDLWCAWCRGAVGIGLAGVAALGSTLKVQARQECQRAATCVCRSKLNQHDHLCCGNFGRIELLLAMDSGGPGQSMTESAYSLSRRVIHRAQARLSYDGRLMDGFCPGFFQGIAGIGYGLLRLHNRAALPNVLLWE